MTLRSVYPRNWICNDLTQCDFSRGKYAVPEIEMEVDFARPFARVTRALVGINEDLTKYEWNEEGPNVGKVREAIDRME
jgi:hypothetical protein